MKSFTVGQKVRIRQWNDMAEEYGLDLHYNIQPLGATGFFSSHMRYLCGEEFTVEQVDECGDTLCDVWLITPEMCEPAEPRATLEEIEAVLGLADVYNRLTLYPDSSLTAMKYSLAAEAIVTFAAELLAEHGQG